MKVLVLNAGSSSLKFTLFDMDTEAVLCKGLVERVGTDHPNLVYKRSDGYKFEREIAVKDHVGALNEICKKLTDPADGGDHDSGMERGRDVRLVFGAGEAGGQHVDAEGESEEDVEQQDIDVGRGADRRHRSRAREAADDDQVGGVEEQVERIREHQRDGELHHPAEKRSVAEVDFVFVDRVHASHPE